MTKQDVVDAVASKTGMTKKDSGDAVEAILEIVTSALTAGDQVTFTGFGKFSTSRRAARQGVNPRTGEKVWINAATVPKFQAGSHLKKTVNV